MNSSYRPAVLGPCPVRMQVPVPECVARPAVTVEGVAADITTRSTLEANDGKVRHVRVGTMDRNITHEHELGWPIALRMQVGERYRVEVYQCLTNVKTHDGLPFEQKDDQGIVFYAFARDLRGDRDEADRRRARKGYVAVWSDNLMVIVSNTDPQHQLKVGTAYKVVVRKMARDS